MTVLHMNRKTIVYVTSESASNTTRIRHEQSNLKAAMEIYKRLNPKTFANQSLASLKYNPDGELVQTNILVELTQDNFIHLQKEFGAVLCK